MQIEDKNIPYSVIANYLSDNFYAYLFYFIQVIFSKKDKIKNSDIQRENKILGNDILIEKRKDKVKISVNGDVAYEDLYKNLSANRIIQEIVSSEVSGKIHILRPKNRTIQKDYRELSKKNLNKYGVEFPESVRKAMMKNSGSNKVNHILKQNINSQKVLSEDEFNYAVENEKIDSTKYRKYGNIYYNVSLNPVIVSSSDNLDPIKNSDEFIARSGYVDKFNSLDDGKSMYFIYGGNLYKFTKGYTNNSYDINKMK